MSQIQPWVYNGVMKLLTGILGLVILFAAINFLFFQTSEGKKSKGTTNSSLTKDVAAIKDIKEKTVLFVPYWSLTQDEIPKTYGNTFAYFGIATNSEGIDTKEAGYAGLDRFVAITPKGTETLLTLRMLNVDTNTQILNNKKLQEKIIKETIQTAKQYGFSGIVLDLEFSSLPFATITQQITGFTEIFYKEAKKENLQFSMLLYGDTFYRFRPYDVIALVPYTDQIFVMGYDFHKARKDPGPNFPFTDKETYGYDFTVMTNDFLNIVPKEKLSIVVGMFGYDWTVDENGKGIKQAVAVTLNEAKSKFLTNCGLQNCRVEKNQALETRVTYTDNEGNNHVVWFEDEESVAKKREFLKEKGITTVGFWAYSYY